MTRARRWGAWLAACAIASCGEPEGADKPTEDELRQAANLRIGHVMVEVGHRFETAGRAGAAERWELAAYEVHEILEMFEDDMGRALLPGDCEDAVVDPLFRTLESEQLPALRNAASAEDAEGFRAGFARVAGSCNGCHAGCDVGFVEVPTEPGLEVPRIDRPAPTPAPAPEPASETEPPSFLSPVDF